MTEGNNRLPVLALEIRRAHADVQEAAKTAARRAIDAGHALIEAKELVKHGQWLSWLKDKCAFSERTAQIYMRIAASGAKSEMVALFGLQAASKAIVLEYPDPFAGAPEPERLEWSIYVLWLIRSCEFRTEDADHEINRLKRTGWTITDWMSEGADDWRRLYRMKPMPVTLRKSWFTFLSRNLGRSREDVCREIDEISKAQPSLPPIDAATIKKAMRRARRTKATT